MNLSEIRRLNNLTQEQLAARAGVSRSLIAMVEAGRVQMSIKTAKKIASILRVPWARFFE